MTTLVDTNILFDILLEDSEWFEWSNSQLAEREGRLAVNQLILAEVSIQFGSEEELEAALPEHLLRRIELPWNAAFVAGRRFWQYRSRGGPRTIPLPDFYIGAHALVSGFALLTRDADFFRTNFPDVQLICPK